MRSSPGWFTNGLSGGALPSALRRSTLPFSPLMSWGAGPTPPSPVVTHSLPSGPKRTRQPSWKFALAQPLARTVLASWPLSAAFTGKRTTRLSPTVGWHVYRKGFAERVGAAARARKADSPAAAAADGAD